MKKKEYEEIKTKSIPDLIKMRDELKRDLIIAKAKSSANATHLIKIKRRDIARLSTLINEKIIDSAKENNV